MFYLLPPSIANYRRGVAARFIARVKELLETPESLLLELFERIHRRTPIGPGR